MFEWIIMEAANFPLGSESDLQHAMEQNLAEHASHLHHNRLGASVAKTADLLIADSGLADDTFNIVAAAQFAQDTAQTRTAETVRTLASTGRPFSWWVARPRLLAILPNTLRTPASRRQRQRQACGRTCTATSLRHG
ncbi:hypothetical protein J2Y66_004116 [Paenarthrobacter nitroguajacolicus]|nr:hypothetical protein [Paenarthrobacter nitroguajacolicus]